ncbi:MAG: four helix bundle protein [Acutalibacteraceae bacterium]
MAENKLVGLSTDFAVNFLKLTDGIKGHYSLVNQLEHIATSIGANIHDAQCAQSKKDFIKRLEIALKESNETSYWMKLMHETNRIDTPMYQNAEKL